MDLEQRVANLEMRIEEIEIENNFHPYVLEKYHWGTIDYEIREEKNLMYAYMDTYMDTNNGPLNPDRYLKWESK